MPRILTAAEVVARNLRARAAWARPRGEVVNTDNAVPAGECASPGAPSSSPVGAAPIHAADTRASGRATPGAAAPRTAGQALSEARHERWKASEARQAAIQRESPAAVMVVVPWPPSGNHAVKHANGAHYLTAEAKAYRTEVAKRCMNLPRASGRYVLRMEFSPPDARRRDFDNAIKTVGDALVLAGFLPDDSMTYMRELHALVTDTRRGEVLCVVESIQPEAA